MMARYKRDELVCVISDALGYDLASRAIGHSSFHKAYLMVTAEEKERLR